MLSWAEQLLAGAASRGDKVMVLGHIPPHSGMWREGLYRGWITVLTPYYQMGLMLPHFFGHMHTDDEWQVVRGCSSDPAPSPSNTATWTRTTGIKWCSGGDLDLGFDPFGKGFDNDGHDDDTHCPWLPTGTTHEVEVEMCKSVCSLPNMSARCAGFTYYPSDPAASRSRAECCFRTDTSRKPADPSSNAECYEKRHGRGGEECTGKPLGVMVTGPSVSYAFPAANPTIRLLEFSAADFSLLDMGTYTADLHAANAKGSVEWGLE